MGAASDFGDLTQGIEIALQNKSLAVPFCQNVVPLEKMPRLSEIPLDKSIEEQEYRKSSSGCKALGELHNAFTGKRCRGDRLRGLGRSGKRAEISSGLPAPWMQGGMRYTPSPARASMRKQGISVGFWTRLPKAGQCGFLTGAGMRRVMVERLEGFCSETTGSGPTTRSMSLKRLHDWGAVIIKFLGADR